MEILSAPDDADNKPAKRTPNAPESFRSFRLPSLEMPAPPPRPPEQSVAKSVQVPEGVLWVSHHPEQEQHRATIEADDKDKDDTTTKKKKPAVAAAEPSTERHEIPIEATLLQPPHEATTPRPRPTAETHSFIEEVDTPAPAHEVFAYPEHPLDVDWESPVIEHVSEQYAVEGEPFASPEPLPPIAGFESHEPYASHAVETADEEEPAQIPVPLPRRPLPPQQHASTGSPQSPNYGGTPNFNAAPNTPPPPPAHTGPGGGGPPLPPSYPSGGANFNPPPGGGAPNYGNFNSMPTSASPNVAPAVNPNLAPGYAPNRPVRGADWVARIVGVAAWLRAGSVKKKLNRRVDNVQSQNKREHKQMADEQLRFGQEQRSQDKEINKLRLEQRRLADERQRMQQRPGPEMAPPAPQPVNAEQQAEQEAALQQQERELHPDERVVQDTWYRSVIKDGQVVRDAIQYGESFRQEQQKEAIQDRTAATATAGGAMSASASQAGSNRNMQMAGSAGAQPTFYDNSTQRSVAPVPSPVPYQVSQMQQLPSGMTSPTLPPGLPTHLDTGHQLPAHTETKRTVSGLAFWVMLAVIIVAFFVAALI